MTSCRWESDCRIVDLFNYDNNDESLRDVKTKKKLN